MFIKLESTMDHRCRAQFIKYIFW